jgi:ribosome biogenesis protein ENP2
VAWYPDSGKLFTANEGPEQHAFFIPQLGPAPRFCAYLDSVVEEMAEDTQTGGRVYEDYKFLTLSQLTELSLDHLIGSSNLRPYMHGYFIHQKLYEAARAINNPDLIGDERAKRPKKKIDQERESRIRDSPASKARVNKKLTDKIVDKRFEQLFEDEDFAVERDITRISSFEPSTIPSGGSKVTVKDQEQPKAHHPGSVQTPGYARPLKSQPRERDFATRLRQGDKTSKSTKNITRRLGSVTGIFARPEPKEQTTASLPRRRWRRPS